ncbi:hypothetical protein EP7_002569 [Isosphaeraceae bacterium EP7]
MARGTLRADQAAPSSRRPPRISTTMTPDLPDDEEGAIPLDGDPIPPPPPPPPDPPTVPVPLPDSPEIPDETDDEEGPIPLD